MTSAIDKELYDKIRSYMDDNFPNSAGDCLYGLNYKMDPKTPEEYSEVIAKAAEDLMITDLNEYDRDEAIEEEREAAFDHGQNRVDQDILDDIGERYPEIQFDEVMRDEFGIILNEEGPILDVKAEMGIGKSRNDPSETVDYAKCSIGSHEFYAELPADDRNRNSGKLNRNLYKQIEELTGKAENYHLNYGSSYRALQDMTKADKEAAVTGRLPEGVIPDAESPVRTSIAEKLRDMAAENDKPVLIDKETYGRIFDYMREQFEHSDLFFLQYYDEEIKPVTPEEYTEALAEFAKAVEGVDLNEESRDAFIDNHKEHAAEYMETDSDIEVAAYDTYPNISFKDVLRSEFGLEFKNDRFADIGSLSERQKNVGRSERDDSEVLSSL